MKKVLLGTSAIALVGAAAAPASAAEWNMRVGGYMEQVVGYASADVEGFQGADYGGVDSKQDAEIFFLPSITMDNGIKIGVNIQLEGNTSGDTIDESFMSVEGSFGRVLLGSENSAGYIMSYGAPDVSLLGAASGDLPNVAPISGSASNDNDGSGGTTVRTTTRHPVLDSNGAVMPAEFVEITTTTNAPGEVVGTGHDIYRGTLGSTFLENGRNNDAHRITYFTPRMAGFQVGVSYARDGSDDSNAQQNLNGNTLHNIFDVGANYVNSLGGVDVRVSGRWGTASNDAPGGDNPTVWLGGANVGFGGFTVGGAFGEQSDAGTMDGKVFSAGASYKTGPWGFSFTYINGENVDNENPAVRTVNLGTTAAPRNVTLGNEETLTQYVVGANYTMAKGVNLGVFGAYFEFDEDAGDPGDPTSANFLTGDDVDGFVIGTGIRVGF